MGQTYAATVRRTMDYGAFVELRGTGGTQALLHISELEAGRVRRVSILCPDFSVGTCGTMQALLHISELEACWVRNLFRIRAVWARRCFSSNLHASVASPRLVVTAGPELVFSTLRLHDLSISLEMSAGATGPCSSAHLGRTPQSRTPYRRSMIGMAPCCHLDACTHRIGCRCSGWTMC